jgi:hypothetical protein
MEKMKKRGEKDEKEMEKEMKRGWDCSPSREKRGE